MINDKNFTGFMNTGVIPSKIEYTGSVRDYFYDNSFGKFDPQFDVVGPVKVDYSMYDPQALGGLSATWGRRIRESNSGAQRGGGQVLAV